MARNSKKPGAKALGRRALSLFMALVMSLSLVQITAFAADNTVQKVDQVMNGVFVVDENGAIKQDEDGNNQTTTKVEKTQDGFTVSKQITEQLAENLFEVQLQVKTTQTVTTSDAAVQLVIDTSGSMEGDRLRNTKNAINGTRDKKGFLDNLLDGNKGGGKIYVSVIRFSGSNKAPVSDAEAVCDWLDITDASGNYANLRAVKDAVADLRAKGGTNLDAGLMLARNRLSMDAVKNAASKYTVLLTDGKPTFRAQSNDTKSTSVINGHSGDGSSCTEADRNAAVETANDVKDLSKLYTICYGVSGEELYEKDPCVNCGQNRDQHHGRWEYCTDERWDDRTYQATTTVTIGDYLRDEIATKDPDGKIKYAYNAKDDLTEAFTGIASSSTEGMNGAGTKVIDPMGQYMQLAPQVLSKELKQDGNTLTWTLGEAETETKGNVTTYTYTVTYKVALVDLGTSDFNKAETYYPTNGATYLAIPDGNTVKKIYFNLPGVKGLRGSLDFTKVAHEDRNKGLTGAQFTLVNQANEALGVQAGAITITAQSDQDGKVSFTGIPSGYTYTLKETGAPDEKLNDGKYVASNDTWTVTVAYGEVTVTKDGEVVTLDKVENTLDPQPEDITITKIWRQSGTNYPEITLYVKNGDKTVATIKTENGGATITSDVYEGLTVTRDGWKFTVSGLPSVDVETGNPLSYKVEEAELNGYSTSYSEDKLTVVNVSTGTTSFTVTKNWVTLDSVNKDDLSATMQLVANGQNVEGATVTLPVDGKWTYTWTNLPEYDANGQITYSVVETSCTAGYAQTSNVAGEITNTLQQAETQFAVSKEWKDGNSVNGRPESIQVQLYRDGEKVEGEVVELTANGNWTYTWTRLDKYAFNVDGTPDHEYRYSAEEVNVPEGYASSVSGNTITNTRTGVIDQLKATKVWNDKDYSFDHDEVTFMLQRSTDGTNYTTVDTKATVNKEAVWTNLAKYDENGNAYTYRVVEVGLNDYETTYLPEGGVFGASGTVTVTNTLKDIKDNETEVTVNKIWKGPAASDVTFKLYQSKQDESYDEEHPFKTEVLAEGQGSLTFTNLPKQYRVQNEDGSIGEADYVYTVVEVAGENFEQVGKVTVSVDGLTWSFTNRNTEKTSFDVTKVWQDMGATQRGEAVITLYRKVGETKDETFSQEWKTKANESHTFTGLAKYDSEGNLYTYYVEETTVPGGYTSSVNGGTVTNTLNQTSTTLPVQKIWVDGGDQSKRGEITLELYQNGTSFATATIDADSIVVSSDEKGFDGEEYTSAYVTATRDGNVWNVTFANLPKYNPTRSAPYEYTVAETGVPEGYTPGNPVAVTDEATGNTTGYTITNTLTQMPRSVEIVKHWVDGGLTNRPELTFTLTATVNGQAVEKVGNTTFPMTITLTDADALEGNTNTWKKTVTNLPKYDDARNVITYQVEETTKLAGYDEPVLKDDTASNVFEFTNTLSQETVSVTATKKWANTDYSGYLTDGQKPVPVNITVGLYLKKGENYTPVEKDGKLWVQTLTANEFQDTSCTFDGLNKYDRVTRELLEYRVLEVVSDGNGNWNPVGETVSYDGRTYEVSYDGNTITNTFEAPTQYYYTVVGNYTTYLDGQKVASASETDVVLVGITGLTAAEAVHVDAKDYVNRKGATFEYIDGSIKVGEGEAEGFTDARVTVEVNESNVLYTITLNYERRTSTPYTPSTSYTVTVNYYDKDSGAVIHQKYSTTQREYTAYDVTAQDKIAIEGYTYVETSGDTLTGTLNGNKVINVYYTKDSNIDDGDTPADPGSDIGDDDVPTTPAQPPKTGDSMGLWIAAAMVSGMGLVWISLSGKKREEEV